LVIKKSTFFPYTTLFRSTLDNYLVVIHDNTIDRTSNGTGKVKDMTLQQLQQFDYGITKDTKYTGQIIPTLDEVLKLLTVHSQKLDRKRTRLNSSHVSISY